MSKYPIGLTTHALDRYIERVKPHLDRAEAKVEIQRLLSVAPDPTGRCDYVDEGEQFDAYIELAPGITLGLRHESDHSLTAVTTMIRTGENHSTKSQRRHEKRRRRRKAQAQKRRERLDRQNGRAKPVMAE